MKYNSNSILWLESRNKRQLTSRALGGGCVVNVFPLVPPRGLSLFPFLCLCWCVQADVLQMCRLSLAFRAQECSSVILAELCCCYGNLCTESAVPYSNLSLSPLQAIF